MEDLSLMVKEMTHCLGVSRVGIVTRETLAGGPPSNDLTQVLPGADAHLAAMDDESRELYE